MTSTLDPECKSDSASSGSPWQPCGSEGIGEVQLMGGNGDLRDLRPMIIKVEKEDAPTAMVSDVREYVLCRKKEGKLAMRLRDANQMLVASVAGGACLLQFCC